jgi:rhamnulokinase
MRIAAIDLGGESGRVVVGTLVAGRCTLSVAHRFANRPRQTAAGLHWDLDDLKAGITAGLRAAAQAGPLAAIGVDTWGVDYGLVDTQGELLAAPWHYRDPRTAGISAELAERCGADALFARSGTAALPFNTIYQLIAQQRQDPGLLVRAHRLLTIPDLLHAWLSGTMVNEWSNAGTTGLTRAGRMEWDRELIASLGLPDHLFGPLVPSGTQLGSLRPELMADCAISGPAPLIVAPACHDTASAVAAVPGEAQRAAWISCGTWSLMGLVTAQPVLSPTARSAKLSNEVAHDGRTRLLTNIMGLWILQECRRAWAAGGGPEDYPRITALAEAAPAGTVIDVDDPRFFAPGSATDPMPARVVAWCREHGQSVPDGPGAIARAILAGLAQAYRRTLDELRTVTGARPEAIHLIGGGSRNHLLCRLTAEACGLPVLAGPDEATALGNVLVQARGLGLLASEQELRLAAQASTQVERFAPPACLAARP